MGRSITGSCFLNLTLNILNYSGLHQSEDHTLVTHKLVYLLIQLRTKILGNASFLCLASQVPPRGT
ncbi:Uncharacterised protein [Pasteurella testudinis]|nr:Uncharacterised protein [Pasteurella testudinis]